MSSPSLRIQLSLKRGDFGLQVDLSLPGQGVSSLFGPSGCGKTTILRAIAGLDRHPDTCIHFGDACWQDGEHFLPGHKRQIGYVSQTAALFPHLSIADNLDYGRRRSSGQHKPLDDVIDLLGIEDLLTRRPGKLSGGEAQRVAIARALASQPKVLLMDEPLSQLDRQRKQEILPYLDTLHRELAIPLIYVSHDLDELARISDHLVLLSEGQVLASGEARELFSRLDLSLAQDAEAEALLRAEVTGQDEHYQLSTLRLLSGEIVSVSQQNLTKGDMLRLRIAARDVSICLSPPSDSSILNVLPARVDAIAACGPAQATVRLLIGEAEQQALLSRISRKSAETLAIAPGQKVFAQVKAIAVLD